MPINVVIGLFIQIIAITVGLLYWKSLILSYRLIIGQVGMALLCQIGARYLAVELQQNNAWVFNIYLLVEVYLLTFSAFFILKNEHAKKIILMSLVVITAHWLYALGNNDFFSLFNWFFVFSAFFIVVIYTVVLFNKAVFQNQKILLHPLFILCIAHIIYFACIIPLFGILNNLFINDMVAAQKLYVINHVVNFLRYSLVALAFYLYGSQAKRGYVRQ